MTGDSGKGSMGKLRSLESWRMAAPWDRRHLVFLFLLAAASGWLSWWARSPEVREGGDEANYVLLSRSVEHLAYRDDFLVDAPPHVKYPPGNPVWIALVRQIGGPDLDWVRAGNALLLCLTGLLIGDGLRRLAGPWAGIGAAAIVLLNPGLVTTAGTALSEVPFTFLVTLSAWAAIAADDHRPRGHILTALASLAATASFLTRSIGLAMAGGVLIWLAATRRWGAAAVHTVTSGVAVAAWFIHVAVAGEGQAGATYAYDLALGDRGRASAVGPFARSLAHAREYLVDLSRQVLAIPATDQTPVDSILWLFLLGTTGTVTLLILGRRWPSLAGYLVLSTAVLLRWPWAIDRLLIPLVPVLAVSILLGGSAIAGRLGPRYSLIFVMAFSAPVSVFGLRTVLTQDRNHRCRTIGLYENASCSRSDVRGLVAAARYLRDSVPETAVVATGKPATVSYFSGRKTVSMVAVVRAIRTGRGVELGASGADLFLLSAVRGRSSLESEELLEAVCDSLAVLAVVTPETLLLRHRESGSDVPDACQSIAAYLRATRD